MRLPGRRAKQREEDMIKEREKRTLETKKIKEDLRNECK